MANEDWSEKEIDLGQEAVDREIERLKSVYQKHSETLAALAASAPTKALSRKYRDLIGDINRSILGLKDPGAIISRDTSERPIERDSVPQEENRPRPTNRPPASRPSDVKLRTAPGAYQVSVEPEESALGRIALILGMAIVVMSLLAFFVWKFGGETREEPRDVDAVAGEAPVPGEATGVEAAPTPALTVSPEAQDFGVIYKGTRVAKSFDVFNNTDHEVTIDIERSECRCLWFDHPAVIPAGGKVVLSVAVDGSRAESGFVSEAVVISTKSSPRHATEIEITAEIR